MTFVLSVKESYPRVCLYTDPSNGELMKKHYPVLLSVMGWISGWSQADWAFRSHSLGCSTGEMALAPFPLSNSTWLEYLPCSPRAEASLAVVSTSTSLAGVRKCACGPGACTLSRRVWGLFAVLKTICIVFNWKKKKLSVMSVIKWKLLTVTGRTAEERQLAKWPESACAHRSTCGPSGRCSWRCRQDL